MSNWLSTKKQTALKKFTLDWLTEVWMIFSSLMKIMIPALLVVRCIELLGWIEALGTMIQPLMILVGLPGETGLVWMAAMMGNIYTGMAVFYQLGLAEQLSIAQVSVISSMMLIAHSLPVEVAIARAVGISLWFTLLLRIGGAFVFGYIAYQTHSKLALLQVPAPQLWQPETADTSWAAWFLTQMMLGADVGTIVLARMAFSLLAILALSRLLDWLPANKRGWFYRQSSP